MARKKFNHINFLNLCAENRSWTGDIMMPEGGGLCYHDDDYIDPELLELFTPTEEDKKWLQWEKHSLTYWGSESSESNSGILTPLRQTIVLFMAAMNDEL